MVLNKAIISSAAFLAASVSLAQDGVACLPTYTGGFSNVTSVELCDASAMNKQLQLKLDSSGCAEKGQHHENRPVFKQLVHYKGELSPQLRDCDLMEVVQYFVEL